MNPINKIRYNIGSNEPLCFNCNGMSAGISSEYMSIGAYAESCYTGWYQNVTSSGSTYKEFYVLAERKSPGGSLYYTRNQGYTRFSDPSSFLSLSGGDFTIEFWFKSTGSAGHNTPILTNRSNTLTPIGGYQIIYNSDFSGNFGFSVGVGSGVLDFDMLDGSTNQDFSENVWYHVVLCRKDTQIKFGVNGSFVLGSTSNDTIWDTNSVSISSYKNVVFSASGFKVTNLRYYIGRCYYNINVNSYDVPIYPIPALGKTGNTDSTPLLINVFQETKLARNYGQRPIGVENDCDWSSDTPFLYDIPSIYRWVSGSNTTNTINNFSNISINNGGPAITTLSGCTEFINTNDVYLQNFDYEDIITSGLTVLYDYEHPMCFFNMNSGETKIYNLVNRIGGSNSGQTVGGVSYDDGGLSNGSAIGYVTTTVPLGSAFTMVSIFKGVDPTFSNKDSVIPGPTALTANSVAIKVSQASTNRLNFEVYNSGGDRVIILSDYSAYTASSYNMFTVQSNGSNSHKVYHNTSVVATDTTTINRINSVQTLYFGTNSTSADRVVIRLFMLYNRVLSSAEIQIIYKELKQRLTIV